MTRLIIVGSAGRMGQMLVNCAARLPEMQIIGSIGRGDSLEEKISGTDAVIDFSTPENTAEIAATCARHGKELVVGTTGHDEAQKKAAQEFAGKIPIVWSSNYSTGVNTLFWLVRKAAETLGKDFDLEIVEMHHRLKKDSPSGTAASLAAILADARNSKLSEVVQHGRQGITGARSASEIGVHSLRGGDVIGDHTVIFAGNGERLELSHKATSRETFALGALRAAQWAVGKPAGLYDMQDVLGLK